MGGATVAVWVLLLIIKLAVAARSGLPFSEAFRTIGDGIFDNILGILPPILLFDFGLEYIQQDKVYEEMTEQITGTIMSRPEVINSFDFDAKSALSMPRFYPWLIWIRMNVPWPSAQSSRI